VGGVRVQGCYKIDTSRIPREGVRRFFKPTEFHKPSGQSLFVPLPDTPAERPDSSNVDQVREWERTVKQGTTLWKEIRSQLVAPHPHIKRPITGSMFPAVCGLRGSAEMEAVWN